LAERAYKVHVLVGDGKPGWIPFTYHATASTRDEAIKRVRKNVRDRSFGKNRVHHVSSARLLQSGERRVH
jgi:hypothetical protein